MPTEPLLDAAQIPQASEPENVRDLQWVLECAERTPAGLSFYPPDDLVMRESADMLAPQPGYLVVDLHGTTDRAKVGPRWLDADELATVLDACDEWDGRPIFLMCCDSGREPDGLAQQLADRLQTEVTAPNKLAWSDFEVSGEAQPYSSDGYLDAFGLPRPVKPPTGKFVTFTPRDLASEKDGSQRDKGIDASVTKADLAGGAVGPGVRRSATAHSAVARQAGSASRTTGVRDARTSRPIGPGRGTGR